MTSLVARGSLGGDGGGGGGSRFCRMHEMLGIEWKGGDASKPNESFRSGGRPRASGMRRKRSV